MSSRGTAGLSAWSLSILAALLGVLSLILLALNQTRYEVSPDQYWGAAVVIAVVFPVVGALIVSHHPANTLGWIFCAVGVLTAISECTTEYATYSLLSGYGAPPGIAVATWFDSWAGNLAFTSLLFIPLLFPDGRPPSRRWRPVVWLTAVVIGVQAISTAFRPGLLQKHPPLRNPLGIEAIARPLEVFQKVALPVALFCLLACVAASVVRFYRSRGEERQQLKWFTYAIGLLLLSLLANGLFPKLAWLIGGFGAASIPVAIGIAILRYRLYDIDFIINRTLVYGLLTASLAGTYLGLVITLQYVFRRLIGGESQLAVVATTLTIAVLFHPLRKRIQELIDRIFYRRKYDAAKTLAAFSSRLREETSLERINEDVIGIIRETMQPEHVSLWLWESQRRTWQ